jgi:hypothetical protein
MSIIERLNDPGYLPFALLFLTFALLTIYLRQVEARRIERKFERRRILVTSFGVYFYGLDSESRGPLRSSGALVLLKNGLYYRARFSRRELFIRGSAIIYLGTAEQYKGHPLYQQVMVVGFLNEQGKPDQAAFRVPYLSQWIGAIRSGVLHIQTGKPV